MSKQFIRSFATKPVFDKILVANRGEIACRIMRTAKKMGIKTVGVYSDADLSSLHVAKADEVVRVGPAPSNQSYLIIENIINAAKKTGAQAIHPGYGFLSEKREFSKAVADNGMVFIGPHADAIDQMGCKIASKKIAKAAGVNVIPGYVGEVFTPEEVLKIAHQIGYPIMIKAAGGGGGKGMRVAWNDEEAKEGIRLSKEEAKSAFDDDRIFIEKFIDNPRHIEIQVLADNYGNAVYVNERECSIQRRNQKVIEEAPSIFLDPATRKKMGEQAVMLCHAVKYNSAGTCEFIVDPNKNFYFLEMNTRLQVEHPVTEYTTGLDLVEHMIRVAAGEKLSVKQSDIGINGWATECRVYAEDPERGFLPSIGTLVKYKEPEIPEDKSIRIDTGFIDGAEISMFYDPLISKLITYGKTRNESIQRMKEALDSYVIEGVNHNIPFLRAILDQPRYVEGKITTKYIPEMWPDGFKGVVLKPDEKEQLAAGAIIMDLLRAEKAHTISGKLQGFKHDPQSEFVVQFLEEKYNCDVEKTKDGYIITANGNKNIVKDIDWIVDDHIFKATINNKKVVLQMIKPKPEGFVIRHLGTKFDVFVRTKRQAELAPFMPEPIVLDTSKFLVAPMPGMIFSITDKKPGDKVNAGEELCIIEAMKMQNLLKCEKDTTIKKINVKTGQNVGVDEILIEYGD
ncbi:methylcrotonoyl-coa carboxylase subunit alpha -related [Anaeramoeba ignava]|uniref:Methylcrotonoyl-coa carboxylase subunit alpha -related n=1 Tax=Anaeramoeba ignava TaxID=1746090 RepID=A0A9Q0L738_ANAIG|nr:methylcrotonoyl-coa carboxylase subunit alpha -related [Anaeramoeba ignava]|eukprot:Anaeramoba_ignava/a348055_2117.p1 GENE.a348055_2117~~a348055_2117.p1  ORF type:complete len:681 (-),score=194.68 a348055_2117:149-2191(-)